jgi:hypothetical protein
MVEYRSFRIYEELLLGNNYHLKSTPFRRQCQKKISGETVEKVPKQILGGDAGKNDLVECATINDLIIMRGQETPENHPITILKGFSTVSEDIHFFLKTSRPKFKFDANTYKELG